MPKSLKKSSPPKKMKSLTNTWMNGYRPVRMEAAGDSERKRHVG
jgi:hypothetical protein